MATKKATVFVVDVGASMGKTHNGRGETDLEWGIKYVIDDIGNRMLTERKTDQVGIVKVGQEEQETDSTLFIPIKQFLFDDYVQLRELSKASDIQQRDVLGGIYKAADEIATHTTGKTGNKLKYERNIMVVTSATCPMQFSSPHAKETLDIMKDYGISLRVLVIDMDGEEDEAVGGGIHGIVKIEDADDIKIEETDGNVNEENIRRINVAGLKQLCAQIDINNKNSETDINKSFVASYEEAIWGMSLPKVKETAVLVKSYSGKLTLGDIQTYGERAISIEVSAYPLTRRAVPVRAKSFAFAEDNPEMALDIKMARDYFVDNPDEPDGIQVVEEENLESGYVYGSEIIPVNDDVRELLQAYNTVQSLEIIGFVDAQKIDRYMLMGETDFIVPEAKNKDSVALSSLVRALYEDDKRAIARYVRKDNGPVLIVALSPYFDVDFESLVMCPLPFANDYRAFEFPSLTQILSKSGKPLPEDNEQRKAREPTRQMLEEMDKIVDNMDLMDVEMDGADGPRGEFPVIEETFNPAIHRIRQAIKDCALTGDTENLPPPLAVLVECQRPPAKLLDKCKDSFDRLHELFDIKPVPKKMSVKQEGEQAEKRSKLKAKFSNLDVESLF